MAIASTSFLSACAPREPIVTHINTICTDIAPTPHFDDKIREFFRANPDEEGVVNWILATSRARDRQCNPKAGGPR